MDGCGVRLRGGLWLYKCISLFADRCLWNGMKLRIFAVFDQMSNRVAFIPISDDCIRKLFVLNCSRPSGFDDIRRSRFFKKGCCLLVLWLVKGFLSISGAHTNNFDRTNRFNLICLHLWTFLHWVTLAIRSKSLFEIHSDMTGRCNRFAVFTSHLFNTPCFRVFACQFCFHFIRTPEGHFGSAVSLA
jgi:hypothetical protein